MKALKWILCMAVAVASAAAVVYAVLGRCEDCRCTVTGWLEKGKAAVMPCYERVLAFFTEQDFADTAEDIVE
ncbi:MAG: hypothetical protein IJC82_02180 [Firmicutes bacterium]|nr:hypothetical protein [Bacillota bacterium]